MVSNNGLTALAPPEFDPVHWDEKNGFWWLSLYEDVASVSKQPDIFSSAKGSRSAARLINSSPTSGERHDHDRTEDP
jgi:hypothetical protein